MDEVVEATGGRLIRGKGGAVIRGISTDSRTVTRGALFVALRGPRHDGHHFIREAVRKGAVGAVVDRPGTWPVANVVRVPNTLKALGDLAAAWRRRFPIPVVAVTGSNGKTTTKEMIASVLSPRYRVLKTEGNLNNLIGLPITLFRLNRMIEAAVVELGMNRPGEIRRLSEIASPQIGVITNIGRAHIQGLRTLEGVARAKAELLEKLPPGGWAVLNAESRGLRRWESLSKAGLIRFGRGPASQIRPGKMVVRGLKGLSFQVRVGLRTIPFSLEVPGSMNVSNALAAIAVGRLYGITWGQIRKGLKAFGGGPHRMQVVRLGRRVELIDDSYNANPESMTAALAFLKQAGAGRRRIAVLGEMLELGREANRAHRQIGSAAARSGVSLLVAVGRHARVMARAASRAGLKPDRSATFGNALAAGRHLASRLRPGDLILLKGSRGMKMERAVTLLKKGGR